ncbi:MAG: succinyl-diaminopimelate desuccinylase [Verrucomicrobiales bacterium]|jgi:succinyl-diaminopimelate desuccinylase
MSDLRERLIQETRDLVLIESTNAKPERRAECFRWLRNHLDQLPGLELTMRESGNYESLLALPKGVEAPEILLCGHIDVVEHPEPGAYEPTVKDGRIFGPGAGDMKGQVVIMLELMRRIHRAHPGASVGLALTSDEEIGGEHGVRFLVEELGLRCGVAIIPDGGSLTNITVEEKGVIHLLAQCQGESAHAARPWLGDNALERLCDRLAELRAWFNELKSADSNWYPTCVVTVIDTPNMSPNRIPERASAVLDIRFPPGQSAEQLLARIGEIVGPEIELEPIITAEPTHLDPDPLFIEATREVAVEANLVRASGGSDSRFFAPLGIPVMLSRPNVGNLHGRDEWIEIDSMLDYFEICCRYLESRLDLKLS